MDTCSPEGGICRAARICLMQGHWSNASPAAAQAKTQIPIDPSTREHLSDGRLERRWRRGIKTSSSGGAVQAAPCHYSFRPGGTATTAPCSLALAHVLPPQPS
ncbi:hypothetical protein V2G26_016766 [Clonostachys chloroleuca]